MAFTARTRAEIRDALLAYWNARYVASSGAPLLTTVGSDAYMEADAVALVLEGYEQRGLSATNEIFPDTASDEGVAHHGSVDGVSRKAATPCVLQVSISGTALATCNFGTATLKTSTGLIFTPSAAADGTGTSATFDGSGKATIYGTCQTPGTTGNLSVGTVLTWSSPPASTNPTGSSQTITTTGADIESIASWAARILARRRERPGGGNRADWRAWMEDCAVVAAGYVYPLYHATYGANALGAVTGVPLGSTRTVASPTGLVSGDVTNIKAYIEGTADSTGAAVTNGQQLRPCVMVSGDYFVELASTTSQNVTLTGITLGTGFSFPFVGTFTTDISCTTTRIYLTVNPVGTIHLNDYVAVPNAAVRGGYEVHQVSNVQATYIDLATPMLAAPGAAGTVRPAPSNWALMTAAILAVFDNLGPGDTTPSSRFPSTSESGPATLYPAALVAAVMGVPGLPGAPTGVSGVTNATCTTPGASVTPPAKTLVIPGTIVFTA